jgi:hypothetical protein
MLQHGSGCGSEGEERYLPGDCRGRTKRVGRSIRGRGKMQGRQLQSAKEK